MSGSANSGCEQVRQVAPLLDDLVGALLKLRGHIETERLGGFHVDHQLEFDWRLDRKFARLGAFEDAIGIDRGAAKIVNEVSPVGHQAAAFGEATVGTDNWNPIAKRKRCDLRAMNLREGIRHQDHATVGFKSLRSNHYRAKWVELLKEITPQVARVAILLRLLAATPGETVPRQTFAVPLSFLGLLRPQLTLHCFVKATRYQLALKHWSAPSEAR